MTCQSYFFLTFLEDSSVSQKSNTLISKNMNKGWPELWSITLTCSDESQTNIVSIMSTYCQTLLERMVRRLLRLGGYFITLALPRTEIGFSVDLQVGWTWTHVGRFQENYGPLSKPLTINFNLSQIIIIHYVCIFWKTASNAWKLWLIYIVFQEGSNYQLQLR
jgi:hypothetical protein